MTLQQILEKRWNAYIAAGESGNVTEFKTIMSSYRLGFMTQHLAKAGRQVDADLVKTIAASAPDISDASFMKKVENGATVGLLYEKDSEDKDATDKQRIEFIMIKFVQETSIWKVDGIYVVGDVKVDAQGKRTQFDFAELPETYKIDGLVRDAPKM